MNCLVQFAFYEQIRNDDIGQLAQTALSPRNFITPISLQIHLDIKFLLYFSEATFLTPSPPDPWLWVRTRGMQKSMTMEV